MVKTIKSAKIAFGNIVGIPHGLIVFVDGKDSEETKFIFDTTTNSTVTFSGLPIDGATTLTIDWGEGNGKEEIDISSTNSYSHTYTTTSSTTTVTINNNLKQLGVDSTNKFSSNLVEVSEIATNITTIADNTFDGCTILTKVNIPDTVTTIGNDAFNGCSGTVGLECESITPSANKIEIQVDGTTKEEVISNFKVNNYTLNELKNI